MPGRVPVVVAIWLVMTSCIGGCSSAPGHAGNDLDRDFLTRIYADGSKQFELTLSLPGMEEGGPLAMPVQAGDERRRGGPERGVGETALVDNSRALSKLLDQQTAELLARNQYCRSGYIVLWREIFGWPLKVRGECNETATAADRESFPDSRRWR